MPDPMNDDLVQRLRDGVIWDGRDVDPFAMTALVYEAADRIEALEAALSSVAAVNNERHSCPWCATLGRIARAALDA